MRIFATSDDGKEIEIKKTEYVHTQVSESNIRYGSILGQGVLK